MSDELLNDHRINVVRAAKAVISSGRRGFCTCRSAEKYTVETKFRSLADAQDHYRCLLELSELMAEQEQRDER